MSHLNGSWYQQFDMFWWQIVPITDILYVMYVLEIKYRSAIDNTLSTTMIEVKAIYTHMVVVEKECWKR